MWKKFFSFLVKTYKGSHSDEFFITCLVSKTKQKQNKKTKKE